MDKTCKELRLRPPSASTSGLKKPAIGKTPLERMYQVAELSRRARLIKKLAHGRTVDTDRAR